MIPQKIRDKEMYFQLAPLCNEFRRDVESTRRRLSILPDVQSDDREFFGVLVIWWRTIFPRAIDMLVDDPRLIKGSEYHTIPVSDKDLFEAIKTDGDEFDDAYGQYTYRRLAILRKLKQNDLRFAVGLYVEWSSLFEDGQFDDADIPIFDSKT